MQKWEYKWLEGTLERIRPEVDNLGDEGWEVAGMATLDNGQGVPATVLVVLKRPKA